MNEESIEVLISTMDRTNASFLDEMNLKTKAIVINQNKKKNNVERIRNKDNDYLWINSRERGLSKSRNLALENATADICLIADDDMKYNDDYVNKVIEAYKKYPEADIIAFQVKRTGHPERTKKFRKKLNWEGYITSMKISSVEITFKRSSIVSNQIYFNPNIGAGTEFSNGEENSFLYDALRNKLKILYLPIEIAEVDMSKSSWFEGYTQKYFETVGAKFYNMTSKYYKLLIFQFVIRKYNQYKNNASMYKAYRYMIQGVNKYKEKHED